MFKEIKVGDVTVPMLANGATPIRYKMVFGKDLIVEFQGGDNAAAIADMIPELAFIMAMAAKAKDGNTDMSLINKDQFITWLEQFEPLDLPMAGEAITNLYVNNTIPTSEAKKKEKAE